MLNHQRWNWISGRRQCCMGKRASRGSCGHSRMFSTIQSLGFSMTSTRILKVVRLWRLQSSSTTKVTDCSERRSNYQALSSDQRMFTSAEDHWESPGTESQSSLFFRLQWRLRRMGPRNSWVAQPRRHGKSSHPLRRYHWPLSQSLSCTPQWLGKSFQHGHTNVDRLHPCLLD